MKPVNHPLFGKVGAFWIEGIDRPFYSIHEALNHQHKSGGNVLDSNGKVLYMYTKPSEPSAEFQDKLDAIPKPDFNETRMAEPKQKSGSWLSNLFSRS